MPYHGCTLTLVPFKLKKMHKETHNDKDGLFLFHVCLEFLEAYSKYNPFVNTLNVIPVPKTVQLIKIFRL